MFIFFFLLNFPTTQMQSSDDLLIVSTGNGPVNIINIRYNIWKVVKPLGLFCALKTHLMRAGAETGSNLCSDDSDIMN